MGRSNRRHKGDIQDTKEENFIEVKEVEEANKIDLKKYSFIKFSETRQRYIFKIRQRK